MTFLARVRAAQKKFRRVRARSWAKAIEGYGAKLQKTDREFLEDEFPEHIVKACRKYAATGERCTLPREHEGGCL